MRLPDCIYQSLNNLAGLLKEHGEVSEAKRLFTEVLRIQAKALGKDHRDVATSLWWLAVLSKDEGDQTLALALGTRALRTFETVLGVRQLTNCGHSCSPFQGIDCMP
jgi:hypothetical protein